MAEPREDCRSLSAGPDDGRHVRESSADVPVQQTRLSISHLLAFLNLRIDVPVDEKEILSPVVIHVEKVRAPADVLDVDSQT